MRHQDLRALLEVGGDGDERQLALGREQIADHVAAHEEIELAEQQQKTAVRLRAAGDDRHLEPIFRVSSIGEGLVEAASRGVREPIGAELHLVERERGAGEAEKPSQSGNHREAHRFPKPGGPA